MTQAKASMASGICGCCKREGGLAWFHGALQMYLCDKCGLIATNSMHEIVQLVRMTEHNCGGDL